MKRQDKPRPCGRRLVLEKLEDRTLPGDTLGWLLMSFLGPSLFPMVLKPAAGPFDNLSPHAIPRRLNLVGDSRTSAPVTLVWADIGGQHQRTGGPVGGVGHSPAGAVATGDVSHWADVLPALLLLGDHASAPPFTGGGRTFGAAAAGGAGALPAGGAAGGALGTQDGTTAVATASTGGVSPSVQSPQEIAAIAYYNSRHAAYEDAHPHSHMGHHHTAGGAAAAPAQTAPDLDGPTPAPAAAAAPLGASAATGQWGPLLSWPLVAVHAHMLPTGKVLLWAYGEDPRRIWDPATDTIASTIPAGPGYNIFCVGHAFLGDGRLLVVGGHVQNGWGLPNASIYDPVADTWTRLPDMNAGRWYPTATTLANGDVLVVSGSIDTNYTNNSLAQVWQAGSSTWRDLSSARLSMPLYPSMFVAPNGKVFNAGPAQMARYLDTSGTGAWTDVAANNFGYRDYGTAVMYEPGKVLLVGGGDPPTASAEVIDLNAPTPAWRQVAAMTSPRRQLNATLLPDGKVLVTGGSSAAGFNNEAGAVLTTELWDPATETWTTLASMTQYRGYHSTALLLPDGRVLSAGGDNHANAEVFSPPYLFQGSRPTVTAAPTRVAYGQSFSVETPDAAGIAKVSLIRLSSVTHAFNENQRLNYLSFTAVAGGLNVTAPANANLAPGGDYMLFVVNSNGVPSVAKIVRIAADGGVPKAPSSLTAAAAASSQVNLTWADNSADETGFKLERRTGLTGSYSLLGTLGANTTAYQDKGLSAGTQYFYRVRATNTAGNSAYSNEVSATTPASGFIAHINFTNGTGESYPGYVKDIGGVYGSRGNGFTYGWNADNTANARDRDSPASRDERYDSLNHMQKPNNPNAYWEIAVPNGNYSVHLATGDPSYIDSVYKINVEGVLAINSTPTGSTHWFEKTLTVTIKDGRLTVSNATGGQNNKIDYIDITAL